MGKAFLYGIGGGGPSLSLGSISISANGTYLPSAYNVDAFDRVDVSIPAGAAIFYPDDFSTYYYGDYECSTNAQLISDIRVLQSVMGIHDIQFASSIKRIAIPSRITGALTGALGTVSMPSVTAINVGYDARLFSTCSLIFSAPNLSLISGRAFFYVSFYEFYAPMLHDIRDASSDPVFSGCTFFNASFSKILYIGASCFSSAKVYPDIDLTETSSIGNYAFYNCGGITDIIMKSSVVGFGTSAFTYMSNLRYAELNASIIPNRLFMNASALIALRLTRSTVITLNGTSTFYGTPLSTSTFYGVYASIYVPQSLYSAYIISTNWVYYSNRFVSE